LEPQRIATTDSRALAEESGIVIADSIGTVATDSISSDERA